MSCDTFVQVYPLVKVPQDYYISFVSSPDENTLKKLGGAIEENGRYRGDLKKRIM